MRLNRGTILLAIALIAIIVVALLVSNSQPDTATPTAIATQETVSVFSGLDSTHAVLLSVQNNTSNNGTVLERDANMQWVVTTATGSAEPTENREVDQTVIPGLLSSYAQLASPQSFDSDQLDTYGLAIPAYTITLMTDEGTVYTTYVGKTNLSGGRYYAVVSIEPGNGAPAADATTEATEAPTLAPTEVSVDATAVGTLEPTATPQPAVMLSGTQTIYLLSTTDISAITALVSIPPYLPLPTSTPTPFPTPNPYSEVEQTATSAVEQTATAEMIGATLTAMATTAPTSTEAPAMSTPEATLAQSVEATVTP
ncbi:MAG: hypothetical protein KC547_06545 [Anaerolineae bacterium]|nr:hypothetical protein [Anaerolineae bacterium]